MSFKPDYGLRMFNEGMGEVEFNFYSFALYSLTVLSLGQYSTMVDVPYGNEVLALSLDFDNALLQQILAKGSPAISDVIAQELLRDPHTPRTIDFDGEVIFGVRARLGELQVIERESFIPLIAVAVF